MKYVFLVGCPRSGTTWLQLLISQHPAIATAQETHLFGNYIAPLYRTWGAEQAKKRPVGISLLIDQSRFDQQCADFARTVLNEIASKALNPSAVLEKTPNNVQHVAAILKLFPDAYFIHAVRDPRSVSASLHAASRSWGQSWASSDHAVNARRWVSDVSKGRAIEDLTNRVIQVRYEDLKGEHGIDELASIYEWLGLEYDLGFCESAFEACRIDRLQQGGGSVRAQSVVAKEPDGFYRKGASSGWEQELSAHDLASIEYIAAARMSELGYELSSAQPFRKPWRLRWSDGLDAAERRMSWYVARLFNHARRLV